MVNQSQSSNLLKNLVIISCTLIATTIAVGSLFIAMGSIVGDIDRNTAVNAKQDATLELHGKEIVQGKLNDQQQAQTATNTLNVLNSINTKLENVQSNQNAQATKLAVMAKEFQMQNKKSEGNE